MGDDGAGGSGGVVDGGEGTYDGQLGGVDIAGEESWLVLFRPPLVSFVVLPGIYVADLQPQYAA